MARSVAQQQMDELLAFVKAHPAWAVGVLLALYPAALVARPLLLVVLPYVLAVLVLAMVRPILAPLRPAQSRLSPASTGPLKILSAVQNSAQCHIRRLACCCSRSLARQRGAPAPASLHLHVRVSVFSILFASQSMQKLTIDETSASSLAIIDCIVCRQCVRRDSSQRSPSRKITSWRGAGCSRTCAAVGRWPSAARGR